MSAVPAAPVAPAAREGLTRRAVFVAAAAAGGGMLIGFASPAQAATAGTGGTAGTAAAPNPFVRIDRAGQVTLILPYVEMGQGAYTSQVQLLAEELEVDPARVKFEAAPPDEKLYGSPLFGGQITGGSGSLRGSWMTLRAAGASARMMLVEAAAQRWKVSAQDCVAVRGEVMHSASGRRIGYGALADAAARLPVPASPALKPVGSHKLIGTSYRRVDTPDKVKGAAKFGIDMHMPGLRYAMVAACPVFNGKLASVDATEAMKIKGVEQVVQIEDAVAVVGATTWAALKGLRALKIEWNEGANAGVSTASMVAQSDAALDRAGLVAVDTGSIASAEANAASRYEAIFRLPLLAHAVLEPINCTVHFRGGDCDVWCGSQIVGRAHQVAVAAAGLPPERVVFHNQLLGGGFGRRLEVDYVTQAVLLAKQVKGPVKITWSREEDMRHDYYRFHNHSRVNVALDAAGRPTGWRHRIVGPNIMARWLPAYQKDNIDLDIIDGASGPYDIPNVFVDFTRNEAPTGMGTGNWRGVGPTRNVFIVESVMDDLAHRAKIDPVEFRRPLLQKSTRTLAAMNLAVAKSGWGEALPPGRGRGIAVFDGFGSFFAMVAQVQVDSAGQLRFERIVCAADVGVAVNPDVVVAQIEGGVIFGLSSVLYGRITVANGRVEQGNFDTYPVLRMQEAPPIEVHLIASTAEPGGVGEPGTAGAIAAVANAVFAATGRRAFALPLDAAQLKGTS
ncbi:molybdopterin cofactor-binding domain-containing protein [Variovorax sp. 770b2]|uniref:xanthine dehydrogenase family protein molybdopterin-binding subunit n=1 Tax=Variovorax sp. 770b2 TaxID=1566271 RepID=UPI0008EDEFE8|nr:molybdopterin cofactor-binding domain-containing protein [Variovorax sp. 770b2]SFP91786.1 isoquinoline 1-oxidoreductase, beta subunit [Variovorax sp. 770b2]